MIAKLRNAAIGFVIGLVLAFVLPFAMAAWLWSETDGG